jgi:O-antigen ligase
VLLADIWLGLAVARRLSSLSIANLVLATALLTMIGHLAIIFARPEVGLSPNGAWRGLLPHENGLGRTSGLALVLALLLPGPLWRRVAGTATAAVLLWHSTALAPLVAALTTLIFWAWNRASIRARLRRAVLGLGVVLAIAIVMNWELILGQFGRTPALSGRLKIWSASLRFVAEQPLWGHGYVNLEPGWFPGIYHAHNGVLSLIVQLGLVGAALFLMDLGLCVWGAAGTWRQRETEIPMLFLLYLAVLNLVEVAPPAAGHFAETILYAAATQKLMRRGLGAPPVDERGDHAQLGKLDPASQNQA